MIGEGKVITETGEREERGEEKDTPTTNWRIHQLTIRPVSYTHLTLPTNREV